MNDTDVSEAGRILFCLSLSAFIFLVGFLAITLARILGDAFLPLLLVSLGIGILVYLVDLLSRLLASRQP